MKNKDLSRFYPNAGKLGNDEFLRKSEGGGGSGLPDVTAEDNGKTVYVADGEWEVGYSEIPNVVIANDATQLDLSGTDFIKKGVPFIITSTGGSKYLIRPVSNIGGNVGVYEQVCFIYNRWTNGFNTDAYRIYAGFFDVISEGVYNVSGSDKIVDYLSNNRVTMYPVFVNLKSGSTPEGLVYGDYSYVDIKKIEDINGIGIYTVDLTDAKSQFDVILSQLKTAASASANTHITKYMPLTGELAAYTGMVVRNAANAYNLHGKNILIKYGDLITSLGSVALSSNYVGYLSYGIVEPDTESKKLYETTVLLSTAGFDSAEIYFDVVCRSATVISQ